MSGGRVFLTNDRPTPGKVPDGCMTLVEMELMSYDLRSRQKFHQWKDVFQVLKPLHFQWKVILPQFDWATNNFSSTAGEILL